MNFFIFSILIFLTLLSLLSGSLHVIFFLIFIKALLILFYFMEIKYAHRFWKFITTGFLILVLFILQIYS